MKGETIISKNSVRVFLKKNDMRVAADVFGQLDHEIKDILVKAAKRAKANHRSTVMVQDL